MLRIARVSFCLFVLSLGMLATAQDQKPGQTRVLVQFKPGKSTNTRAALRSAGGQIHHELNSLNTFAVTLSDKALEAMSKNPNVSYIEDDARRHLLSQDIPYGIDKVQARDVWDSDRDGQVDAGASTGAGTLVCIIDSGLNINHEDAGMNVVGGFPSGWDNDACGHGTHVAGTIAANNNNLGVVGVSPGEVDLYIFQVFTGADCAWTYSSDLVAAAEHCQSIGADIISMSLGGSRSSRTEDRAFANLYSDGILSIAAAGNDGNTRMAYPASYDSVISVAATDSNDALASFSQVNSQVEIAAPGVAVLSTVPWKDANTLDVGTASYSGSHIDLAARGSATGTVVDGGLCDTVGAWSGNIVLCERGVVSFNDKVQNAQSGGASGVIIYNNEPGAFSGTLSDGNTSLIPAMGFSQADGQALVANNLGQSGSMLSEFQQPGSSYEAWDGTSMATPHVAGVAALIMSSGNYTNQEVRDAMNNTAIDLGTAGRDNSFGYGLVQAADAIASLDGPPPGGLTVSATGYTSKGNKKVDLTWSGAAGSNVDIYRNGSLLATVSNSGSYTDTLGKRITGTFSYQICEAGTGTCSNTASVTF